MTVGPLDVEAALVGWLPGRTGVPAFGAVPASRPTAFITVERVGGGGDSVVIDRPVVAIQCWGRTRAEAAALAGKVAGLVGQMVQIGRVTRAEKLSQQNFPDLEGGNHRYQVVVGLVTT